MDIIYGCYGGAHSSPVAAAIHLGNLPEDRTPSPQELMATKLFDKVTKSERGHLVFAGKDQAGNNVYVFPRGPEKAMQEALLSGWRLAGREGHELRLIDTLKAVNNLMRIGGFLSRGVGIIWPGRPLVIQGTRKAYPDLVRIVRQVKEGLKREIGSDMPSEAPLPVYAYQERGTEKGN